jgi:hypothetical protein
MIDIPNDRYISSVQPNRTILNYLLEQPIYEIATAHKLDLKPTNWDNTQLYDSRGEVSDKEEVSMENMWRKIQKGINQRKNALRKSADGSLTSLSQVVDESIKEMGVTMESKEMKWIRFMLSAEIENEFAAVCSRSLKSIL